MSHQFLIHDSEDEVGVAVRDIEKGEEVKGVTLSGDKEVTVTARDDIPLSHKIALADKKKGDTVRKYGIDIGNASKDIEQGDYVHTHNLVSGRWVINE